MRGTIPGPTFYSLSGLEQLRAYVQLRQPSTPHCHLLGYRLTQASTGSAVLSVPISPWFEIQDDLVDLSAIAELSLYVAATTAAPPATHVRTVTLSLRYLRPCTVEDESVIARSRVLHAGSSFTTAETLIEDSLGRAVAHATGSTLTSPINPAPPPLAHPLDERIEEAVYASPGPSRRGVPTSLQGAALPPAGALLGMEIVEASARRAVTTMPTTEWFCNTRREVEAGIAATQGTVTAALIHPYLLESDERSVTFETSTTFLGTVVPDGRPLTSTASVTTRKGDIFVVEVDSMDADGQQVLVGRGTLMARPKRSRGATRPSNRVLLTVLFTDVVGSTERASEVGDQQWREMLDEHNGLVRRQIESHAGREVKTTGDGFLVTFDSPSRAVECARAIRAGVARLGLEIRAGVHTGECELVGSDVAGLAVHVASRVQSAAEPGEILVSSTVRDLVKGSGLKLTDRGVFELKGLSGEWPLLSVDGDA